MSFIIIISTIFPCLKITTLKKKKNLFIDIPLETWLYNTVYTVELTDDFTNRNLKHYPHKHTYGGKQMKYDQT